MRVASFSRKIRLKKNEALHNSLYPFLYLKPYIPHRVERNDIIAGRQLTLCGSLVPDL